jgi:hypothetical protein
LYGQLRSSLYACSTSLRSPDAPRSSASVATHRPRSPSDPWPFRDKAEGAIVLFGVLIEDVQIHPQFHFPTHVHLHLSCTVVRSSTTFPPLMAPVHPSALPRARTRSAGTLGSVGRLGGALVQWRSCIDALDNDDGWPARCHDGGSRFNTDHRKGL